MLLVLPIRVVLHSLMVLRQFVMVHTVVVPTQLVRQRVVVVVIPRVVACRAKLVIISTVSPQVAANVVVARLLLREQRLSPVACMVCPVPLILTALRL